MHYNYLLIQYQCRHIVIKLNEYTYAVMQLYYPSLHFLINQLTVISCFLRSIILNNLNVNLQEYNIIYNSLNIFKTDSVRTQCDSAYTAGAALLQIILSLAIGTISVSPHHIHILITLRIAITKSR